MGHLSLYFNICSIRFFDLHLTIMSAAAKAKATKKPATHPKYAEMISEAVENLAAKKGSSKLAIVKYIQANFKVGDNAGTCVRLSLKRMVAAGDLVQVTGVGANGSFKLKKKAAPKPKKAAPKKPVAPKKPAKKTAAKAKKPAKKATAKKPAKK